jgi:RimJ/RimL family protein N-acetyltransferase
MRQEELSGLHQLAPDQFARAQPIFGDQHHLAVTAALAGEAPAELYADDPLTPRAAILILWNHRIYLAGAPGNSAFAPAFARLLRERFAPQTAGGTPVDRTITYSPASWEERLPALFANIQSGRMERQYYRLQVQRPVVLPALPSGFRLHQIDAALVAETTLINHQRLLTEICSEAPSVDDFLQRRFGYYLQYGQELVAWCLSEYNHADHCELDIETVEAYQRRGLATATALATISHAQSQGITSIGWHCWKRNIPSINLALKLGFEKVEDYPVWHCRWTHQNQMLP